MSAVEQPHRDAASPPVRPPIVWALAIVFGVALKWIVPAPFVPKAMPGLWIGPAVFALALALFFWANATMRRAGTPVPTDRPTKTIVEAGPYGLSRNPIYLAMALSLVGLAVALDTLWLLATAAAFVVLMRYAVIAREEAYLEGKFGDVYRAYRRRVRRWL
jgi:protein-S-isoprenylcysteine O-methyltransferase Ste14